MQHLFLECDKSLEQVASEIFEVASEIFEAALRSRVVEAESLNVHGGTYFEGTFKNLVLRVESNSYDYEDDYEFMVTLKNAVVSDRKVSDSEIQLVAKSLQNSLVNQLRIPVALELESSLDRMEHKEK
jgi:hypothetical protein